MGCSGTRPHRDPQASPQKPPLAKEQAEAVVPDCSAQSPAGGDPQKHSQADANQDTEREGVLLLMSLG